MTKWTTEQMDAIYKTGSNIIVSAGAGSGKTAVLSERVLNKLDQGVHINELLILTFTKAAASEMKDRIRKKISSNDKYKSELHLLSSSYITTFDSYALSVLKKYHYLLNISNDIGITDESLVTLEEKKILDNIFEEKYASNDENFEFLIKNYCIKNDKVLRNNILKICNTIDNYIDKYEYIDYLKNDYYSNIDSFIDEYKELLNSKREFLKKEINNLNNYFESNYVSKVSEACSGIINCDLDELYTFDKISLPSVPRNSEEDAKIAKENVKNSLEELIRVSNYGSFDDIKKSINDTKRIVYSIIDIVEEYIELLSKYKKENNIYTFSDIAYLSIKILKENPNVCEEIRSSFKEIMIDEYQDTNDIQDMFISLIENNNVYMVGDIKQSIYRFRGSNPNIFKDKYDKYSLNDGGIKIDLIKNFRSRDEVLNNINNIFELIMDKAIGGASYKESHEMVYGNTLYDDERLKDFNYDIDILEYEREKSFEYSESEIEIFSIAKDIKDKINSGLKVFDRGKNELRSVKYSDFVIILDRSKYFNDYKRIFEYLGLPLSILRDDKLNTSSDILLIRNIIDFILKINNEDDVSFKYDFISIARSFLYEYSDNEIFEIFKNNSFKETSIYKELSSIESINSKTSSELFLEILDITKFYEKLNKIGDYENINVRMNTIYNLANGLNDIGFSISDFIDYLNDIIENGIDIKYSSFNDNSDSIKIMTIHKSKGLEFPICYFADMNHKFNVSDINDTFIVDKKYGLIVPSELDTENNTVVKELYKASYIKEEISEKIRLLYVALTRAREKMIIVIPKKETIKLETDSNGVIDDIRRLSFNKLSDFIYSVRDYLIDYYIPLDIKTLPLTKDYLFNRSITNKFDSDNKEFNVKEISIDNDVVREEHFSKESVKLINSSESNNMKFGTKIHEILEYLDYKNYDESIIEDKIIRSKINNFMKSDLLKNINEANIYHEYEFIYTKDNTNYHGIIDLLLEYDDHIDIVDFKLKNVDDEKYINQLNGYKNYISSISNKKINLFLYSILDSKIESIG